MNTIIQLVDRILWSTRVASLTSPTYIGDHMPYDPTPAADPERSDAEPRRRRAWETPRLAAA